MTYNANSIRILKFTEIINFDWYRAEKLAKDYTLPLEWVKRGFEASRRLGIEPNFFVDKYILKHDLPKNAEFEQIFIEILNEDRQRS